MAFSDDYESKITKL